MSLERFFMVEALYSDSTGPFTVNDTDGNAYVFATGITLTSHTGKMVLVTDTGGKRAWGILSASVDGDNVFMESAPLADNKTFCEVEASFNDASIASVAIVITSSPYIDAATVTIAEQIRTPFEGGYVSSRRMHSRSRDTYDLMWKGLSFSDLENYLDFFKDNQGTMFLMTRPMFNTVLIARFSADSVTWSQLTPDAFAFSAMFEEA